MDDNYPFDKQISAIEYNDLEKLIKNKVSEGWNIEYKEYWPEKKKQGHKIAKSISSFANSEGGWYIIGIKEEKGTNKAEELIGFWLDRNTENSKEKIANIIKEKIRPLPYFESKLIIIQNNLVAGGLLYDLRKAVLIVHVEQGNDPPYFVDGSIFVRVGESSGPEPMKDRYMYEKLIERKEKNKLEFEKFCENTFDMEEYKNDTSVIFLEINFYLPFKFKFKNFSTPSFRDKLLKHFSKNDISSTNDNKNWANFGIQSSDDSYILRHINDPSPWKTYLHGSTTIELFRQGHMKILYPVSQIYDQDTFFNDPQYNLFEKFMKKINEDGQNNLKFINGTQLIFVLIILLNKYRSILENQKISDDIFTRIKIINSNKSVLFFNSEKYIDYIDKNQLPTCFKKEIKIPHNMKDEKFIINYKKIKLIVFEIITSLGLPNYEKEIISEIYI